MFPEFWATETVIIIIGKVKYYNYFGKLFGRFLHG